MAAKERSGTLCGFPIPQKPKERMVSVEEDDPVVEVAISESLQPSDQPVSTSAESKAPPRVTIDDMIGNLQSRNDVRLLNIDDSEGNTLIYIDAAQQQPEQNRLDYEAYVERCANPFRLKKETLMRLNSTVINSALEPGAQYRVLRRRKLVGKLPPGVKYVLDLSAPGEGDDAALLLSSLSCSQGLRNWNLSQTLWAVSYQLVGGQEEYLYTHSPSPGGSGVQQWSIAYPEYSPVRYRAAVERLLAIADGTDPKLDAATKVWTTFGVAKYLGIVQSPLTDYIVTWLRAYPNSIFLEVFTETSHIMADHLQVAELERDTFAMLVGEEALDSMVRIRIPQNTRSVSTFGRKKEDLPEKLKTRVEYASKQFAERVISDFENLKQAKWIESLPEVQRLLSFPQPELRAVASLLVKTLTDYVRGFIMHIQCSQYHLVPEPDRPALGTGGLFPDPDRRGIFNSLPPEERLLTRTFWIALQRFVSGNSNLNAVLEYESYPEEKNLQLVAKFVEPTLKSDGYCRVRKSSIKNIINSGTTTLDQLWASRDNLTNKNHPLEISKPIPIETSTRKPVQDDDEYRPRFQDLTLRPKVEILDRQPGYLDSLGYGHHVDGDTNAESSSSTRHSMTPSEYPAGSPKKAKTFRVSDAPGTLNAIAELDTESTQRPEVTEKVAEQSMPRGLDPKAPLGDSVFGTLDSSTFAKWMDDQWRDETFLTEDHINGNHGTKRRAEDTFVPSRSLTQRNYGNPPPSYYEAVLPLNFFNLESFLAEAESYIRTIAHLKLSHTDALSRRESYEIKLLNTLVSLDEPEFKYLPLWADGCDDDSGGVFNEEVAIPDVSFATAGPSILHGAGMHTVSECDTVSLDSVPRGIATPGSSVASSEYHLVHRESGVASIYTQSSNHTTAGYLSDNLDPERVYAAGSVDTSSSVDDGADGFAVVGREEGVSPDLEEENARREVEAIERAEAEKDRAVRAGRTEVGADESYADLWAGEEGDSDADEMDDGFDSEGTEGSDDTVMVNVEDDDDT